MNNVHVPFPVQVRVCDHIHVHDIVRVGAFVHVMFMCNFQRLFQQKTFAIWTSSSSRTWTWTRTQTRTWTALCTCAKFKFKISHSFKKADIEKNEKQALIH
jgi:hypothetical protein